MYVLKNYAIKDEFSKGRLFKELLESERLPFLKDRERVIHSIAFRRLEYKTQVMVNHAGDHFRTRLTHTLEVAHNARYLAMELGLNLDLAETIAFVHDLGHPPFGHAGEDGLNLAAREFGGFNHNYHAIKIISQLEKKYAGFDGLNLTWETLEGALKHNGPLERAELPQYVLELDDMFQLELSNHASLEAQVAAISDDIAYCAHDIDDGFRAGVFNLEQLLEIDYLKMLFDQITAQYQGLDQPRLINELCRSFAKAMIKDVKMQTEENLASLAIETPAEVRAAGRQIVDASPQMQIVRRQVMEFLKQHFYRYYKVNRMTRKAHMVVKDLFNIMLENPNCMPSAWFKKVENSRKEVVATHVIDYIAGMTDRYAIEEHNKFFDPNIF